MSMHNEMPREHPDYYRMERPERYAQQAEQELKALTDWGSDPTITNQQMIQLLWDCLDTEMDDTGMDFIIEIEAAGDKFLLLTPPATLLELAEANRVWFVEDRAEYLAEKDKVL